MGHGGVQGILNGVAWDGEDPHVGAPVALLSVWAVAQRVVISPVRLVVNHAGLVLAAHVAEAVVEEGKRVRPLPVAVRQRLALLLVAEHDIRVEEEIAGQDANTGSEGCNADEPVVVRRRVGEECAEVILKEEVRERRIRLRLQHLRVSLAQREVRELAHRRVGAQVSRAQGSRQEHRHSPAGSRTSTKEWQATSGNDLKALSQVGSLPASILLHKSRQGFGRTGLHGRRH